MNPYSPLVFVQPIVPVALLTGAMLAAPAMSRPNIVFSVTVPDGFRDSAEARKLFRNYRRKVALIGFAAAGVSLLILFGLRSLLLAMAVVPAQFIAWIAAFAETRKRVLPHAAPLPSVRQASLAPRPDPFEKQGWMQVLPFAPLAVAAAVLLALHGRLPARYPLHWNMAGRPDRWAAKSPLHTFAAVIIGTALCAAIAALTHWGLKSAPRRYAGSSAEAEARFRGRVGRIILAMQWLLTLTLSTVALAPLMKPAVAGRVLAALPFLVVAVVAAVVAWCAKLGAARRRDPNAAAIDYTPDRCWKAGLFYYNPNDPVLVVEKRSGVGYTFNFAHPAAWAVIGGLILIPVISFAVFGR